MAVIGFLACLIFCAMGVAAGGAMFMLGSAFGPSRVSQVVGILVAIGFLLLMLVVFKYSPISISITAS